MSDFTIFTGKTVDDAIQEACKFFTTEREKLEVEIITGGSTGIFGLVGKKKAQVKARRRQDPSKLLEESRKAAAESAKELTAPEKPQPKKEEEKSADSPKAKSAPAPRENAQPKSRENREAKPHREPRPPRETKERKGGTSGKESREPKEPREAKPAREPKPKGPSKPRREQPAPRRNPEEAGGDSAETFDEPLPLYEDKTPASQELLDLCREVLARLLAPILEQEPGMTVEGSVGRVSVIVQDEEHSGLLIGREGQTLAALQYLANRILARKWPTPVRLQINTGDYREKQDENLRKMALYLADKAKNQGRAQSTKPLSSYHRRVVHMALQADDAITTRSKGDGPMKRVIILPKRSKPAGKNGETQPRTAETLPMDQTPPPAADQSPTEEVQASPPEPISAPNQPVPE
ncbi:protein jag [Fundidesulfovibrio butyratiphilus]